jgi:hypothetical protein
MAEKVRTISAANEPFCEVAFDPEGTTITIRHAEGSTENPQEIILPHSIAGTLADALMGACRQMEGQGK